MSKTSDSAAVPVLSRREAEAYYPFLSHVPPTYDGSCRLLNWKHSARDGMEVDFALSLPGPLGGHAFRGMSEGKEAGQRFVIIVSLPRQADGGSPPVIYHGEALLVRWSENGRTGMMIRMMIDDGPDGVRGRHPFFGMTTGRLTGESFEICAWGIDNDEQGMPASKLRKRTPFHTLTEVQQSNILCRDSRFRAFLRAKLDVLVPEDEVREGILALSDNPDQFAAAAVRAALKVSSRSVMNRDSTAGQEAVVRWRALVMRFESWSWGIRH